MNIRSIRAVLAAAALLAAGPAAAANCQMVKILEVPVTMEGLQPTVPASVNGHETRFMIDTGAFFSVMTTDAADRFALKKSVAPFGMSVRGLGGASRMAEAVRADEFKFAGAGFKNIQFLVGGRMGGTDVSGVIGQNIMGPFDVEYDFANGVMRFFKAKDCGSDVNLAYWSQGNAKALSRINIEDQGTFVQSVLVRAKVNGETIRVKIDSGSSLSYLNRRQAAYAGVQIGSSGVTNGGVVHGAYGGGIDTFLAPFASFEIGNEEIKNTQLRVADIALGEGQGDMLLGADFFLSHRILISNTQKKVYFTYNGGPVFRFDRGGAQQAQSAPQPAGAAAGEGADKVAAGGSTLSAGEYARRGAASAARRDYAAAIADYTRALDLDPKDATTFRARALARLNNRQPLLATADLDEALKLQPDDLGSRMLRAEVFLQNKDVARAQADFEAAQKAAPANADLSAQIGSAYARAGLYDEGLRRLDAWIAAHPRAEDIGGVLAARCWTRAVADRQLEAALADCDQALKKERNSVTMSDRGLVLLRLGRFDESISQFSAALKAEPRLAPALYGRGLAELKKGNKAAADADIAAAASIAPALAQQYRRYGLSPDGASSGADNKPAV
jgi:tetratricopeptide (TPR) repeat protein/predicted aspartyl protease